MNYQHAIHWAICNPPSSSSIYPIGQEQTDMQEVIPAFVITLPLCLTDSVNRHFLGGTLQSLLQMIYEFYQEPVTPEEVVRIMNLSAFNRNRMIHLSERQQAGEIVRRVDVVGPSASYEGIRANVLLLDI
jgi:hypothetical protein